MKISSLRFTFWIFLLGASFSFSFFAFGEEPDLLKQALDLVHQVESPTGNPPSDAQQIDLLSQAIELAQQAPNHRLKGHRVLAIQAIRSAITEIRAGDPNHQAAVYLHTADTELSTSISLSDAGGPVDAPATNVPVVPPPASIASNASDEIMQAVKEDDANKVKALLKAIPALSSARTRMARRLCCRR